MKNNKLAYSLQEIIIAITVVGVIAVLMLSMTARNRQHEFNAKLDKTEATIASILEKDFIMNTGRDASSYNSEKIRNIINHELRVANDCTNANAKTACWAKDSYGDYSTSKIILEDKVGVALKDVNSDGIGNNIITTFLFLDANGPAKPNKLHKDIRSLKIIASKSGIAVAANDAWGECLCPNGIACPKNDVARCTGSGGTCTCSDGTSCTRLSDCPDSPDNNKSGTCTCSDGTSCPAGNAKLCGGDSSGVCKCITSSGTSSTGTDCSDGTIASCSKNGGCICPNGDACPDGDTEKCPNSEGICKCPDNKQCPNNDLSKCPNISGCRCSNGAKCPDGTTTASCYKCPLPEKKGYSIKDPDDAWDCYYEKNCKIENCPNNKTLIDEDYSYCYCGCTGTLTERGEYCCSSVPDGNNTRWANETGCDICSKPNNSHWDDPNGASCNWSCDSGYERSGDSCIIVNCNIGKQFTSNGSFTIPQGCKCNFHHSSIGFKGTAGNQSFSEDGCCMNNGKCKNVKGDSFSGVNRSGSGNHCKQYKDFPSGSTVNITREKGTLIIQCYNN